MKYVVFFALIICSGCISEALTSSQFEVRQLHGVANGLNEQISVSTIENQTRIDVSSEHGIGSAAIKCLEGNWNEIVIVRLHLSGLEGFSVTNHRLTLHKSDLVVKAYDNDARLLDKKYLLDEKGYYEVELPNSIFVNGASEIIIHWVDFYR